MTNKILIDTDPGVDDTMAILLAFRSPELDVIGLSAVFGNSTVQNTARNALFLVELAGNRQIPVAGGAGIPLVISPRSRGAEVHGDNGMGGINLPQPTGELLGIPAAQFIVETILANPGEITLVPLGPLTNIALALQLQPGIAELVKEVVIMGGAAFRGGNASPVAEANIYNDPHAASIVFQAGWKLTMVGLDVTMQTVMTGDFLNELGRAGNLSTDLIRSILPFYQKFHDEVYGLNGDLHTHDPSAIAYLINPTWYETVRVPVFVETNGYCSGQTVVDARRQIGDFREVNVCTDVDSSAVLDMFMARMTA